MGIENLFGASASVPGCMLFGVLGLVFGSFLSCTAVRLSRGEDFVTGRSHCEHCGVALRGRDLVPVLSFLLSGGKCRYCKAKLSAAYPVSELVFAALLLGLYLRFGNSAEFLRDAVFIGLLFVIAVVDVLAYEVPDGALLLGLIAWAGALPFLGWNIREIALHLAAGIFCGGAVLLLSLVLDRLLGKESLGGGDVKLLGLCGLYLGFFGSYLLLLGSSVLGLLLAAAQKSGIWTAQAARQERAFGEILEGRIPFAPAICAAAYLVLLVSDGLREWYMGLVYLC